MHCLLVTLSYMTFIYMPIEADSVIIFLTFYFGLQYLLQRGLALCIRLYLCNRHASTNTQYSNNSKHESTRNHKYTESQKRANFFGSVILVGMSYTFNTNNCAYLRYGNVECAGNTLKNLK